MIKQRFGVEVAFLIGSPYDKLLRAKFDSIPVYILPPIDMQRRIADEVFDALDRAKKMKKAAEAEWTEAKAQFEKELLGEQ